MKFQTVIFRQGDAAEQWLKEIDEEGEGQALSDLISSFYSSEEPEEECEDYPWGGADSVYHGVGEEKGFTLSYNAPLGYVSVVFDMRWHPDNGPFCGSCGEPCEGGWIDFGLGPFEFWGAKGYDSHVEWVSTCCESGVFTSADLSSELEAPTQDEERPEREDYDDERYA